jgi:pseudaminic acid cytidylyltransferase
MNIAIIPARGGSKRIPHKNIKFFHGKPIIAYSIETALQSHLFERVIVSTDDPAIAKVALQYGAEVPFIRPENIADDHAPIIDVMQHAIAWLEAQGKDVNIIGCIFATAPFINGDDLTRAIECLKEPIRYVFSATEYAYPVWRAFKINSKQCAEMLWPENYLKRSQDLEKIYHDAGMFYLGKAETFMQGFPIIGEHAMPYVLPHYRVQDIDQPEDWQRAENYYQILKAVDNSSLSTGPRVEPCAL